MVSMRSKVAMAFEQGAVFKARMVEISDRPHRHGKPWTPAEDRRLRAFVAQAVRRGRSKWDGKVRAASVLGRTIYTIEARLSVLRRISKLRRALKRF